MTPAEIASAAHILASRRQRGEQGPLLPESCRPKDLTAALAIQTAVSEQLDRGAFGGGIGGWKCGLPAPERWVVAPIYRDTISQHSPCAVWARAGQVRIEPELAFVFGHDLPPRAAPYSAAEVDAAIGSTRLALELIDSRYFDADSDAGSAGFLDMLADGLVNQGLFLGPEVDAEQARNASELAIHLHPAGGEPRHYAGRHPSGNPRAPLYWLAEFLRSQGQGIAAGQVAITGSYAGTLALPLETDIRIAYGELGELQVRFGAR